MHLYTSKFMPYSASIGRGQGGGRSIMIFKAHSFRSNPAGWGLGPVKQETVLRA